MISYRKYNHLTDYISYKRFAEMNWGKGSYQSSYSFISWLESNPNHCINLAFKDDQVCGCFHEFEAPVINKNEVKFFYSLHDLMVDRDKVSQLGLKLMQDSILQDSPVILSGAIGRISRAYKRLGSHQFQSHWYRKFIFPKSPLNFFFRNDSNVKIIQDSMDFSFMNNKDPESIPNVIKIMSSYNYHDQKSIEFFKWRFMQKDSPLTFFVSDKENKNIIIFSLGLKKIVPFLRIFSIKSSNEKVVEKMLRSVEIFASKLGIPVILYAVTEDNPPPSALGYKPYKEVPKSYIFSRKEKHFEGLIINGFSTDLGFNSITLCKK